MKKLTVKEATEQGLKIGDEVWIKSNVEEIGDAGSEIRAILKSIDIDLELYCFDDDEIYLPEAHEPEARKVRVGDVYEWNLENDKDYGARFMQKEDGQECIKSVGGVFEKGYKYLINYFDFVNDMCWKFLYNVNDQNQEPEQKQEPETLIVGEYWHHPENGNEWLIESKEVDSIYFDAICTKNGGIWDLKETARWLISELINNGYIRGRHPENVEQTASDLYPDGMEWKTIAECGVKVGDEVEWKHSTGIELNKITFIGGGDVYSTYVSGDVSDGTDTSIAQALTGLYSKFKSYRIYRRAQPEQWQPKVGELVWVKFMGCKMEFVRYCNNGNLAPSEYAVIKEYSDDSSSLSPVPLSELEPYTNQDAPKIDFSVSGQWLTDGISIVLTEGFVEENGLFTGRYIGQCNESDYLHFSTEYDWKICTPEQIKLIEALQKTLK